MTGRIAPAFSQTWPCGGRRTRRRRPDSATGGGRSGRCRARCLAWNSFCRNCVAQSVGSCFYLCLRKCKEDDHETDGQLKNIRSTANINWKEAAPRPCVVLEAKGRKAGSDEALWAVRLLPTYAPDPKARSVR